MKKFLYAAILFLICGTAFGANHFFTGLPIDANGWTDFSTLTASGYESARVVFVSSATGNDTNAASNIVSNGHYGVSDVTFDTDGFFQAPAGVVPFATLAGAYAYCRDGYPDILLLERGGQWSSAGLGVTYLNSGSGQTTPTIIASYGVSGNRPKLSDLANWNTYNKSYIMVSGLHFYDSDWVTSTRSFDIRGTASYQTFEDLYLEETQGDVVQGAGVNNIVFRRCIWTHNAAYGRTDGQIFAEGATNLLLEECLFHEPWYEDYPDHSLFGRHLYFAHYGELKWMPKIRGCIFYKSDREGVDLRIGGEFYNNIVADSYLRFGDIGSGTRTTATGTIGENVLAGSVAQGDATIIMMIANDGTEVRNNILADTGNATKNANAIVITGNDDSTPPLPIAKNINVHGNVVYGFVSASGVGRSLSFRSSITDIANISIHDNDFQMVTGHGTGSVMSYPTALLPYATFANNKYYSTEPAVEWFTQGDYDAWLLASEELGSTNIPVTYTDPTRSIGSYNGTLGGTATTEAFMTAALGQSRYNWDSDLMAVTVNNYIRAGFDKTPISYSYDNSPTYSEVYLSDSFESGNLSSPTGTTGSWGGANTGTGDSVVVSSDRARTGTKSLKFTYSGNADVCDDAYAEQRFNIGQSVNEAYVGYYIYFPSNYAHRTPSGCSSNANNNKVFRIWSENADYTGDPIKMGASLEASSVSRLFPEAMKSWVNNEWAIGCNGSMGDVSSVGTLGSWTLTANDLNKWLHFEFHTKVDEGTGNAAMEFWVDGVKKFSDVTLDYSNSPCVRNYFKTGYLMGWANSGFTQDTSIYIDDVIVASSYIGPGDTPPPTMTTYYLDADGDGFGPVPEQSQESETDPGATWYTAAQLIATTGDCNDSDAAINPGATEICGDGIDQDCSGADLPCDPGPHSSYRNIPKGALGKMIRANGVTLSVATE